ncbi:MAG: regulator [Pantoea sp.]|nr:regulator [Pantoea sp.]
MFAATNSVSRRYLKRGELIAKRRAEAAEGKARVDVSAERVSRAVSAPSLREKREEIAIRVSTKYQTVSNEAGRQIHAVQKMRGKSVPLI